MGNDSPEPAPRPGEALQRLEDVNAMRALAHPSRMALWELLTVYGPMTATQAAARIAESPSNCSFHLRQLAKYGLVEEAAEPGTTGRARPWRVTHVGYTTNGVAQAGGAAGLLSEVAVSRAVERQRDWQHHRADDEPYWRDVAGVSQTVWWVTREEAEALKAEILDLVHRHHGRLVDPAQRPPDARPVELLALLHPLDEQAGGSG